MKHLNINKMQMKKRDLIIVSVFIILIGMTLISAERPSIIFGQHNVSFAESVTAKFFIGDGSQLTGISTFNATYDALNSTVLFADGSRNATTLNVTNDLTVGGGFWAGFIGSITNRISKIWATEIDAVTGNFTDLNMTGEINLENDAVITRTGTNTEIGINSGGTIVIKLG